MKKAVFLVALYPSITWALQGVFLWPIPQTVESGNIDVNLDVCYFYKSCTIRIATDFIRINNIIYNLYIESLQNKWTKRIG